MTEDRDIIHEVFIKPSYDTRTFETRLLFIRTLFDETFDKEDIMGRCILHKLTETTKNYERELTQSINRLMDRDPLVVIKYLKNK